MLINKLIEKYNSEIAGTTIRAFSNGGWRFSEYPGETEKEKTYHYCLEHLTAQYNHALDEELKVFVDDFGKGWVLLYESIFNLVEMETKFAELVKNKTAVEPYGMYQSIEEFEEKTELKENYNEFKVQGEKLNALYFNEGSVIKLCRFYSIEFELKALKYK